MSKFENRESSTLNYKILDVKSVERDESGEIISMEVEVIRNDTPKEGKEGTPLNAESLNAIIKQMIKDEISSANGSTNNNEDASTENNDNTSTGTEDIETVSTTLQVFPDGSSSGVASATFDVDVNSEVTVQNDYSFNVTTNISEDNKLTITVYAGDYPEGGVMEASFDVIVKNKTTGVSTKKISIIVEFLESLEDED